MTRILTALLVAIVASPAATEATVIMANGFPHLADCGAGAQEVYGYHWAVLNEVGDADMARTWTLQGTVSTCALIATNQGTCLTSALGAQPYLSCDNLNVRKCNRVRAGIKIRSWAFFANEEGNSFISSCTPEPDCDGEPGPRSVPESPRASQDEPSSSPLQ